MRETEAPTVGPTERVGRLLQRAERIRTSLVQFLEANRASFEGKAASAYGFFLTAMFAKALKTYDAIVLLCKCGLGQDAAVLQRCLVEILINVHYVAHGDRQTLARRFLMYDGVVRKRLWDTLDRSFRAELNAKMTRVELEEEMRANAAQWKEFADEFGDKAAKKRSWSGVSTRDMASKAGLARVYDLAHRLGSEVAHSTTFSLASYLSATGGGVTAWCGGDFEALVVEAIGPSPVYLVSIAEIWCQSMAIDPSPLTRLVRQDES